MSRKRKPEAVYLAEGDILVKHTHDVELADQLARDVVIEHDFYGDVSALDEDERTGLLPAGRPFWCRIINALPGSNAEAEGWGWQYMRADGPAPGVFRAVEYLRS